MCMCVCVCVCMCVCLCVCVCVCVCACVCERARVYRYIMIRKQLIEVNESFNENRTRIFIQTSDLCSTNRANKTPRIIHCKL